MIWTIGRGPRQQCCCVRADCRRRASRAAGLAFLLLANLSLVAGPREALAEGEQDVIGIAGYYAKDGSGAQQGSFTGQVNVNELLGADRFYDAGITGTNAVMANIEAGHVWTGHETLAHVGLIPTSGALGEFDRHATVVASVMGGRPGGANPGEYQKGMAPDAALFSGTIATGWSPGSPNPRYSTSFSLGTGSISTYGPYRAAIATGITGSGGTRTADVVNSSWVVTITGGTTGTDRVSGTIDALVSGNPHTLFTVAAGNTSPSGAGPNRVLSPATGYNNLAVASLAPNGIAYDVVSTWSNGGPNDYYDASTGTVSQARQVIDIAAPGEQIAGAYYGGETGGNRPSLGGSASGPAGGPDWYWRSVSGTSVAAPAVAGGAALLYDAAYTLLASDSDARDARVMKAVLMNSADKTAGWNNGQVAHTNGNGGVRTSQGLDNRVGTGRMNLDKAFDQFLSGTTDVAGAQQGGLGSVDAVGWDFGRVAQGLTNDYLIDGLLDAGSTFTATLTWFRDRLTSGTTNFTDASYDNLDLELWSASSGSPTALISESLSLYNNAEHFSFAIPETGSYMLRVRWAGELFDLVSDPNQEDYGLAWAGVTVPTIPEPAAIVIFVLAMPALVAAARRRR
jgi:hypothetical protein